MTDTEQDVAYPSWFDPCRPPRPPWEPGKPSETLQHHRTVAELRFWSGTVNQLLAEYGGDMHVSVDDCGIVINEVVETTNPYYESELRNWETKQKKYLVEKAEYEEHKLAYPAIRARWAIADQRRKIAEAEDRLEKLLAEQKIIENG
ncbi:hypothetical protein EKI60_04870 [Candidatus Saccharibacteria bacterium]|nr:MAG: hypothetical protein EKI60_04870 [Candidatus Saccharibacteria bacterium]